MLDVLIFPADCNNRTGMSLISTLKKLFEVNLCVLKSGKHKPAHSTEKFTVDLAVRVFLPLIIKIVAIFSDSVKTSVASIYRHIHFFKCRSSLTITALYL